MGLSKILEPISFDLMLVQEELGKIISELEDSPARAVFEHYFKTPGKLLRPSLLLLSAAAADEEEYRNVKSKLIKVAAAIELVHNASLIHDDIVDQEKFRRGQKTLNNAFGSKIAVMAGSALFARAISIVLEELPKDYVLKVIHVIRKMGAVEINEINRDSNLCSREEYFELINGKTALLMGNSCMFGAGIVTSDKEKISELQQFGINFGMAYQIVDDYIDHDHFSIQHVTHIDAGQYASSAVSCLDRFEDSIYKTALFDMLEYILSLTHIKQETDVKCVNK